MGRRENRMRQRRERLTRDPFERRQVQTDHALEPYMDGHTKVIPVLAEGDGTQEMKGLMTSQELMKIAHNISDKELNRIAYQHALDSIKEGTMPEWPEDDFGITCWFQYTFITPRMREVFPEIVREYLAHEDLSAEQFSDMPYPRSNEETWNDAYYFRILAIMIKKSRSGSDYSRNFLLSLYKVYYKEEYNDLKRLNTLTFLNLLEIHDENCRREGLSSGHTVDGGISFHDATIERNRHEAGWMDVYGDRLKKRTKSKAAPDKEENRQMEDAADFIGEVADAPDEPPLQPVSARLFIMCELMGIPVDATCNYVAADMNQNLESMAVLKYLASPDFRRIYEELAERNRNFLMASYPEMGDPYRYQTNEKYLALQVAEQILEGVFRRYDTNIRVPYESTKFQLADLMAEVMVGLDLDFPGLELDFNNMLMLSMVEYMGECLCELMLARDSELDDLLHFSRRIYRGEFIPEAEASKDPKAEKLFKAVSQVSTSRDADNKVPDIADGPDAVNTADIEDINLLLSKVEELELQLKERDAALAEERQKVIQQRYLFEQSHSHEQELLSQVEDAKSEHMELVALREYVYSLREENAADEIDEQTQEEMIKELQDKNVAVLGGTDRWAKRMKRIFPSWTFIPVSDVSIGGYNALERADFIYMYTDALKHSQYYRTMNMIRSRNKMLFYLGSTNMNENIVRFYNDLCKSGVM